MSITNPSLPKIFQQLSMLSARIMQPEKADSRKETHAISEALEALKIASTRKSARVEKKHLKYLGQVCDPKGKIHNIALKAIQENLQHYRKRAWKFDVKQN